MISVVSLETRKAVAKTARAVVKNGNCQWQDPIVESTRLQLNQTTNEYEEKFYKLVVSSVYSSSSFCHSELSKQKHPKVPCASANFCFQLLVKCWVWSDNSLSVHASRVHHVLGYLVRHSSTLESLLISIIQHRELCP